MSRSLFSCKKLFAVCCGFVFLMCSSVLRAEISWIESATTISTAGASDGQAAFNDNDQATVIWIDGTDIKFANWTQAGGWTAEAVAVAAGGAVTSPRLVMNNAGQTMVTWIEGGTTLKYSIRDSFTGSWSAAANVSATTVLGAFNDLVINNSGQVIAAWQVQHTTLVQCRTATYVFGSTWSADASTRSYPSIGSFALELNDSGLALLNVVDAGPTSWGGTSIVTFYDTFATVRASGFSVANELTISSIINLNTTIPATLSLDASNLGIATWVWTDNSTIFDASFNGIWTKHPFLDVVKSGGNTVTSLQAKRNDSGFTVITWTETDGTTYYIKAATSSQHPTTPWSIRTLYSSTNALTDVHLTLDNRGEGIVAWNESVSGTSVVKGTSLHFTLNAASVIETFSDPSVDSTLESVDENTGQEFIVVWRNNTGTLIVAGVGQILISPPTNPRGAQKTNKFLTQTEYYNHISWTASPSPSVNAYKVVANGEVVGLPTRNYFDHRAQKRGRPITYTITAINPLGEESTRSITITVP